MLRVLVTGAAGQLASCLKLLRPTWIYLNHSQLDITNVKEVQKTLKEYDPSYVINCAAYTNVEKAEDDKLVAMKINGDSIAHFKSSKFHFIQISTDYVFDGRKAKPYEIGDKPKPINAYGISKLRGEEIVKSNFKSYSIIRTSWVYSQFGKNFFKTIYDLAKKQSEIKVINDQFGGPTYALDLASFIVDLIESNRGDLKEILHYSSIDYCSWYDFASEIIRYSNPACKTTAISSDHYKSKAKRPKNSQLKSMGHSDKMWKEALRRCVSSYL